MTLNPDALREALRNVKDPTDQGQLIIDHAHLLLKILPELERLVEARARATQGEWKLDPNGEDLPYIFAPQATDSIGPIIARFDYSRKDRDFILEAANTITKLQEMMEERDELYERIDKKYPALRRG